MKLLLSDRPLNVGLKDNSHYVDLSALSISNCVGCYSCWVKTPGRCVIKDDAIKVYPLIAKSDCVIYVSKIKYGGYDTLMKTMLERAIPIQKAFIRLLNGEVHHVQREVVLKKTIIIAYGTISEDEKAVFRRLVERNSHNMNFQEYKILFTEENKLEDAVAKEVVKWEM